jgi:hypothetical protein
MVKRSRLIAPPHCAFSVQKLRRVTSWYEWVTAPTLMISRLTHSPAITAAAITGSDRPPAGQQNAGLSPGFFEPP